MENISIKVHPPWYARGTPVTNPRDGPPFDLSAREASRWIGTGSDNVKMEAIRGGPSARGEPGEFIRLWLTLNVQQFDADRACPGLSGSKDAVRSGENFDLSAREASRWIGTGTDNVKMLDDNVKMMEDGELNKAK